MELMPEALHQRTPLFIGSECDVRDCETFLQGRHPALGRERRGNGVSAK
jgi:hypothetical protein